MTVTPNQRLKRARIQAGHSSARAAAQSLGFNANTYGAHETGTRGISAEAAKRYALAFGVSLEWLLTGEGGDREADARTQIPVVGYVGAGAEVFLIDNYSMGDGIDQIDAPPGCKEGSLAVRVRGDSMSPAYRDGDCIIYSERTEAVAELVGAERVVWTEDGRVMVKTLLPGTAPGRYTLISHNAPPIGDVAVIYAARIEWIRKG
ncbi:S24 family peptidase [Maricaulis sp.]|uniref:S24 family peptidase n=1 Tax=Maricaulis sp. TaxID=1486257 RepID=UPI00262440BC|nr:S24 family peptidase [Maricaulis sp.]MDF1769860.1 S24 family peptidase [Maricaulis sp.]